jgi:hypothetical protein
LQQETAVFAPEPQQEDFDPPSASFTALPYFSLTTSFTFVLISLSPSENPAWVPVLFTKLDNLVCRYAGILLAAFRE